MLDDFELSRPACTLTCSSRFLFQIHRYQNRAPAGSAAAGVMWQLFRSVDSSIQQKSISVDQSSLKLPQLRREPPRKNGYLLLRLQLRGRIRNVSRKR